MPNATEDARRQMLVEVNAQPGSREYLEAKQARSGRRTSFRRTSR